MAPRSARNLVRGFTLFELIIVMAIVGVLISIAIPSYRYVTSANRVAGEINTLVGDLQFARAEAIKEGQTVTVCIANSGATDCGSGTAWQSGWIVFSDVNTSQAVDSASDVIYRVQSPFTGADTFAANNALTAISFNREGFASGTGGASLGNNSLFTLHTTPVVNATTRCVSLNVVGMITVQTYGAACT